MASQQKVETPAFKRLYLLYSEIFLAAEDTEDGKRILIGSKTKVYKDSGLSMKYYRETWQHLEEMGCITVHTGNARVPSRVEAHRPPDIATYTEKAPDFTDLESPVNLATIRKKVASLEERIPPIDLNRLLLSLDQRLLRIEDHLGLDDE